MKNLTILNKKEIKEILKQIEDQWGAKLNLNYAFLKNNQNKVFLINREIQNIPLEKLRVNNMGMYFCEIGHGIRLSIEGSQLIGSKATKNILEVSNEQAKQWMTGQDIETKEKLSGFIIIKHGNDYLSTGKYSNGKILNYVTKERRVGAVV